MIRSQRRIQFVFNKVRGNNVDLKAWEEFDSFQQSFMLKGISLDSDDFPIVAMYEGPNKIIVTTKRIISRKGKSTCDVELNTITTITAPGFVESSKLDLNRLLLTTIDGSQYLVETPPGESLFVLWNLLLGIVEQPKV